MNGDAGRIVVIHNRRSGTKAPLATNHPPADVVRDALRRAGVEAELISTTSEAEARQAVRTAVERGARTIVAAGGDGTAGLVAAELLGSSVALGLLPLGTVMNIGRSLGLPRDLDAAAAVIAAGCTRRIDVGETDGGPFFEAGSIGIQAAMFREAERFGRGDWSSLVRTIWVALRYRPGRMRLELDDRVVDHRALMTTVSIGPYFGLGMQVAPDARLDDGLFDVRVFRGFSKPELLRHLVGIAFGRYRYAPHVSTYRSATVRVTGARALPARADARDIGPTPVWFRVRPRCLTVIVPDPDHAAHPGVGAPGG